MATSGNFKAYCTTSGVTDKYIKFEWTAAQSVANNTSTISWKLLGGDPDGGYVKAGGFQVVIDGDTEYSKSTDYRIKMYTDTLIASGTKTITHNADGTRNFTVRIRAGIYNSAINTDGSKEFTLTTIPRKSSLSVSNGTLGTAQTLAVTRQSTSFKHSIKAVVSGTGTATYYINASGGLSTTEVKHTTTSIPFTPPLSWASQNTTGTSVSVAYTITTYNGSTNVGATSYTKTYQMPASIKPTCILSVSDAEGYKDVFGAYIQGKSKFNLSAAMEYAYGSPLSSKSITADGKTYSADTAATAVITNAGTLTISASVKDKRGREGTDSESVNVAKYTAPKISSLSVHRCNEDGTLNSTGSFAKATYSFAIDDFSEAESDLGITLAADNAHSVKVQYKKSTETSWTDGETVSAYTATGRSFVFAAADDASYDVQVVATDSFGSVSKATSVSTAEVLMHFGADGKSIAFGKVSEKSNAIEFGKQMYDRFGAMLGNGIGFYESGGSTDPDTTLESLIITKVNTPVDGVFYYIQTDFYSTKSVTSNRAQFAIPYASNNPAATRYFYNGAWSDWRPLLRPADVANVAVSFTAHENARSSNYEIKYNPITSTCFARVSFVSDIALTAGTLYSVGTVNSNYHPAVSTALSHYSSKDRDGEAAIGANGVISFMPKAAISAGSTHYFAGFWFV